MRCEEGRGSCPADRRKHYLMRNVLISILTLFSLSRCALLLASCGLWDVFNVFVTALIAHAQWWVLFHVFGCIRIYYRGGEQ